MPLLSLRSIFLLGLPLISIAHARSLPELDESSKDDAARWRQEVDTLPGESIRAVVESNLESKYQEGVFKDGHHGAIAAVHSEDASLASRLVDLARQDAIVKDYLRRRQDSNTTTTTEPTTTSSVPETSTTIPVTTESTTQSSTVQVPVTTPTSATSTSEPARESTPSATTQTGILVPIVTSMTASDGSVILSTTNAFETTAQTSVAVGITTTNSNGQTMVTSAMAPATIITSTNSAGSTIVTTSPVSVVAVAPGGSIVASSAEMVTMTDSEGGTVVLSRPSAGATYTTRDSGGRIATVTYQPGGGTVSQVRVQTTTLPNGQRSTITSFAEVGGETGTGSGSQATGATPSGNQPGLQSGATIRSSWYAAASAMVGGIFIGIGLLW